MITIWIGKLLLWLARLRGGGSALPGLFVEKHNPKFLQKSLNDLKYGVIVISGTNGKTTTTKIVSELLSAAGLRVFTNDSASNFVRGIISSLLAQSNWRGRLQADVAVLELDEAHSKSFIAQVKPRYSLLLNVFPDQTDRFSTEQVSGLLHKIAEATTGQVVTNRDNEYLKDIKPAVYFGKKESEQIAAKTKLKLLGFYHYMNAAAALKLVQVLLPEKSEDFWLKALAKVEPAKGRGEKIDDIELVLVKNPEGFRLALETYTNPNATMIAVNDQYADGRDTSWLGEVDFSSLKNREIITSGSCSDILKRKLQKAGIKVEISEPDLKKAIRMLRKKPGEKYIFCSYTAMAQIRKLIS